MNADYTRDARAPISIPRSTAVESATYGVLSGVARAGVTDAEAPAAISGSAHPKAAARRHSPLARRTAPRGAANVISLPRTPEAAWVNREVIRVDGGEHVSGAIR